MTQELARYDAMCRAIADAYAVDEVKDIHDKAVALETYARQAHNVEAERQACEIRLRAERKAGALSRELETKPGTRSDRQPLPTMGRGWSEQDSARVAAIHLDRIEALTKRQQLDAAGVSKKQAEQWEKLAGVDDATFEAALADKTQMPSTSGIIRAAAEPKITPVSKEALWLWGRLLDFERLNLLAQSPAEVLESMTPQMLDDVHSLAPRVTAWLQQIGRLHDLGTETANRHHRADH